MNWSDIHVPSLAAGTLAGLGIGCWAGYLVSRRSFAARLDTEVASVKAHYNERAKLWLETGRIYTGPVENAAGLGLSARTDYTGPEIRVESLAITEDDAGGTDDEIEAETRDADDAGVGTDQHHSPDVPWPPVERDHDRPYIICADEFGEEFPEYQTLSITWYNGDKVLVDDQETPIQNVEATTGPVSRAIFGGVSDDDNIAYVRNEKLRVDFEIAWDNRSYADVVLNYGNPNRRDQ